MGFKLPVAAAAVLMVCMTWYFVSQKPATTIEIKARALFASYLKAMPDVPYKKLLHSDPTPELLHLGRMLFNDPILSRNNDTSCATCHLSNRGFADGGSLSFGALGKGGPTGHDVGSHFGDGFMGTRECGEDSFGFRCSGPMFRNSISTINVAFRASPKKDEGLLWDGRFGRLEFQVLLPIHTQEELCGSNPVPSKTNENIFRPGGPLFKKPVTVKHSHLNDRHSGKEFHNYNAASQKIDGLPSFRDNGEQSTPNRNECLAIAVAKLRSVKKYRQLFNVAFKSNSIDDQKIGRALAAFVATHISKKAPWDRFVAGEPSLTESQILGMASFLGTAGVYQDLGKHKVLGAGCVECHAPPFFGGSGYKSLGVRSDGRSALARPKVIFTKNSFYLRLRGARGVLPQCHVQDKTVGDTSPDMGRALATFDQSDCFKFRVPPLRNVIETFPYFHHGTARGQGHKQENPKQRSMVALKQVVRYHLRGPVNIEQFNRQDIRKIFFDKFFLLDPLIPTQFLEFSSSQTFPIDLNEQEVEHLVEFIALALWDQDSTQTGDLGNTLAHPKTVPSGFLPSISRDSGHQQELPPNM